MKQLTLNGKNYLFVPVPDGAFNFKIDRVLNEYMKYFHLSWNLSECEISDMAFFFKYFGGRDKYPKDLVFLTTTTDINEERAAEMVGEIDRANPIYPALLQIAETMGVAIEIYMFLELIKHHQITGRHAIIQIL